MVIGPVVFYQRDGNRTRVFYQRDGNRTYNVLQPLTPAEVLPGSDRKEWDKVLGILSFFYCTSGVLISQIKQKKWVLGEQ